MIALLFPTLHRADAEARDWIELRTMAQNSSGLRDGDMESIPFVLPFNHSPRIQDAIGFQWPAFWLAGALVPVPALYYGSKIPAPFQLRSYVALLITVGLYWFGIATWINRRIAQRTPISSARWIRVLMGVVSVPTVALLLGFLLKDALQGWPEGPQGAYGITAWLGLMAAILVIEAGWVKQLRRE